MSRCKQNHGNVIKMGRKGFPEKVSKYLQEMRALTYGKTKRQWSSSAGKKDSSGRTRVKVMRETGQRDNVGPFGSS